MIPSAHDPINIQWVCINRTHCTFALHVRSAQPMTSPTHVSAHGTGEWMFRSVWKLTLALWESQRWALPNPSFRSHLYSAHSAHRGGGTDLDSKVPALAVSPVDVRFCLCYPNSVCLHDSSSVSPFVLPSGALSTHLPWLWWEKDGLCDTARMNLLLNWPIYVERTRKDLCSQPEVGPSKHLVQEVDCIKPSKSPIICLETS